MLPWTDSFQFDTRAFDRQLQCAIDAGYTHLYLMGTAGEGYALSDAQFDEIVSHFSRHATVPHLHRQIGIISLSMAQIISRIARSRELGFRMFQISLPSWGALTDTEVMAFFLEVCGKFPDCQFLHYNLPRAKRLINGSLYRRIADAVPNLVATKNSTSDYARVADLMRNVPDLQHFFLENGYAFGCLWGECSLLCSFDLLFPKSTWEFYEAGQQRDLATLWRLHKDFNEVETTLFGDLETEHIDGAFDKTFCWLKDPGFSNRLLPPYLGLTKEQSENVRRHYLERCSHLS
jgi:dihydrodipicolinate synthase/N-acetylneuraminate lyase